MEEIRKPFQGVYNIVRFNWHFYVYAFGFILLLVVVSFFVNNLFRNLFLLGATTTFFTSFISLLVSYYVYDYSDLYRMNWLRNLSFKKGDRIVNINAGFDECSVLLAKKIKDINLKVFDFYDSEKHTEISIERARKAYSPYPKTVSIKTTKIPLEENSADHVFVLLAAHEIRNDEERILFFKEIKRILKEDGKVTIVEHLRDLPNFMAYTIGFLHFYSKRSWLNTFQAADLSLSQEFKITPFVSSFILNVHGTTT